VIDIGCLKSQHERSSQYASNAASSSRALDNFKKIRRSNYTVAKIRSRMTSFKDTWNQCLQSHAAVFQAYLSTRREKIEYFQENQLDIHADLYQITMDYMAECLEELEQSVSPNQSLNNSTHSDNSSLSLRHLPAIQLPPFSGKFEEWESFRDRFTLLIIQNKKLSDFNRMHFLASNLTGRARDTIASFTVTADNFEIAWKALAARFENKSTNRSSRFDIVRFAMCLANLLQNYTRCACTKLTKLSLH